MYVQDDTEIQSTSEEATEWHLYEGLTRFHYLLHTVVQSKPFSYQLTLSLSKVNLTKPRKLLNPELPNKT